MVWISGKPGRCLNPRCGARAEYLVVDRETPVNGVIVGEAQCSVCGETSRYTRHHDPAPRRRPAAEGAMTSRAGTIGVEGGQCSDERSVRW